MNKFLVTLVVALGMLGVASAQSHKIPNLDSNNQFTGSNQFTVGACLGCVTVGQMLAISSPPNGDIVTVLNGATSSDCAVGGGNNVVTCQYNGAWAQFGGGSGLPSGCSVASGVLTCAGYQTNGANPNYLFAGPNASFTSCPAGVMCIADNNGVIHAYDVGGNDYGRLLGTAACAVQSNGTVTGIPCLDTSGLILPAQLASNPANCNNTTFYRGDGTCNAPNAFANAFQAPNNALAGTVLNQLATPSSQTSGQVTNAVNGFGVIGPVSAGAGNSGNATIQFFGSALCVFDGATTNGDYVVASSTVPGDCHDAGNNLANVGVQQLLGISLASNVGAGTYSVWFVPLVGRHVVAQGSTALATATITTATCATAVTATATGASATTDNLSADFSADPTATTGYSPSAGGILTIIKFITANTINFKVCNNTGSNITPGAVTLKWSVWR